MSNVHVNAVWKTDISPPTLKLVLLVLADRADATGAGIHYSMATIAQRASISRRQAVRCVSSLIKQGLVSVVNSARQHATPTYCVNIGRVHLLARGDTDDLSESSRGDTQGAQGRHPGRAGVTPMSPNTPPDVFKTSGEGEAAAVAVGGRAPAAAAAPEADHPALPVSLNPALFADLVANGRNTQSRVRQLTVDAQALAAGGHDLDALCRQAIAMGWARWPSATVVPKAGRTKGSKPKASGTARAKDYRTVV